MNRYGTGGNVSQRQQLGQQSRSPMPKYPPSDRARYKNLVKNGEAKHFSLPKINSVSQKQILEGQTRMKREDFIQQRRSQIVQNSRREASMENAEAKRMYSGIGMVNNDRKRQGTLESMFNNKNGVQPGSSYSGTHSRKGMTLQYSNQNLENQGAISRAHNLNDALHSVHMPGSTKVHGSHLDMKRKAVHASESKMSGQKKIRQANQAIGAKPVEVDDIPSDISADEWGEIQKFSQKLHE